MTDISSLEAALKRAEASGRTDDDLARVDLAAQFGREVIDIIERYAEPTRPDGLTTFEVEKVLAGLLGCIIKSAAVNKFGAILIAYEMASAVMTAATEE